MHTVGRNDYGQLGDEGEELAYDYALREVVRSAGILAHEARSRNKAQFTGGLSQGDKLQQAMLNFVTSNIDTREVDSKVRIKVAGREITPYGGYRNGMH